MIPSIQHQSQFSKIKLIKYTASLMVFTFYSLLLLMAYIYLIGTHHLTGCLVVDLLIQCFIKCHTIILPTIFIVGIVHLLFTIISNNIRKTVTPIIILLFYGTLVLFFYLLGSKFLSNGWNRVDSSIHRDFLYRVDHYILPSIFTIGSFHVVFSIVGKEVFLKAIACALILGSVGPIYNHIAIQSSSDPFADFGYLLSFPMYLFFTLFFLILSSILILTIRLSKSYFFKNNSSFKEGEPTPKEAVK